MFTEELVQAGLTHNEVKVYLCLNGNHDLSASQITKKTGVHRRNVYDSLDRLMDKGLINETILNNRKKFNAAHPKHLLMLIEAQKAKIEAIVPSLTQQYGQEKRQRYIKLYKGIAGVKASFTDSLDLMDVGETYYAMGCINMKEFLGVFIEHHHKERAKKKIESWTLFNHKYKERSKELSRQKNHHSRVLPKNYDLPVQTVVYGKDVVCQILIHKEPFVVQVVDEMFASNYRNYFHMLWEISKDAI
jgi:sugar-specific transcriptional regulator TrmB